MLWSVWPATLPGMKSRLALLLPLALVACRAADVKTPDQYDLSGTLTGDWGSAPRLRLALVGVGLPNIYTNNSTYQQSSLNPYAPGTAFGMDLPGLPNVVGVYQVIAFDDRNNNATFDLTEPYARNRQFLIYSPSEATTPAVTIPASFPWAAGEEAIPAMNVKRGWNVYDRSQPLSSSNPYPVGKISNYDLSR